MVIGTYRQELEGERERVEVKKGGKSIRNEINKKSYSQKENEYKSITSNSRLKCFIGEFI